MESLCSYFRKAVRKYDAFKVGTYITDAMIKLFPSKTSDDCTVALICGLPVANNG
jgi:hypothetical protein